MIDGGLGDDVMVGGAGNDTYIVNSAGDTVSEQANEGTDTVQASVNHHLDANVENLTLTGTAVEGYGNDGDNFILGNAGDNILYGLGGNDYLKGWYGNDTMYGGTGNDTYKVSAKGDVVVELAGEGNDTVISVVDYTLGANVENLVLQGVCIDCWWQRSRQQHSRQFKSQLHLWRAWRRYADWRRWQ